jgi:hypothetical protein
VPAAIATKITIDRSIIAPPWASRSIALTLPEQLRRAKFTAMRRASSRVSHLGLAGGLLLVTESRITPRFDRCILHPEWVRRIVGPDLKRKPAASSATAPGDGLVRCRFTIRRL